MANVFVVVDCKKRKPVLATPSARKAMSTLKVGVRIEVWVDNIHIETIYSKQPEKFKPFVLQEKQYIGRKQKRAEERNRNRRSRR